MTRSRARAASVRKKEPRHLSGSDLTPAIRAAVVTLGTDGYPVLEGFTDAIRNILNAIASDSATTAEACKANGINPIKFWALRRTHPVIDEAYITALELGGESMAQKAIAAAEDATPEMFQVNRLKFDAYRWAAGKRYARVYGDKAGSVQITNNVSTVTQVGEAIKAAVEQRRSQPQVVDVDPVTGECTSPQPRRKKR